MRSSSDAIGQLACALAKAQAELINPRKTLTATIESAPGGDKRSYRYAPLSEGLTIIRKTLGRYELAIVQTTDIDSATGAVELTTTLVHGSGEWIATRWPVCSGEACGDPKVMGAALTYARRYSLFALVGVAGEDDLDAPEVKRVPNGHGSAGAQRRPTLVAAAPPIPITPSMRRARPPRTFSTVGPNGHVRGTGDEVPPATAVAADPLADLAQADNEDALMRWAIAAMPHRNGLDDASRAALDAAFRARAQSLGTSPDLVLAFADDGKGAFLDAPSSSGDPMNRKLPYDSCRRRSLPARLRADILVRQNGCCADCATRLILGAFVFDHRPPLSLRDTDEDANDPDRLAAICQRCDERKTPEDLKAIARTKRLAFDHQDFLAGQRSKVPGRRAPSRRQFEKLERSMIRPLQHTPLQALNAPTRHRAPPSLPAPKDKD